MEADASFSRNFGMEFYGNLIGAENHSVIWADPNAKKTLADELKDEYRAARKVIQVDGIKVDYLLNDWDGYDTYKDMASTLDFGTEMQRAFFASSDEEALKILNAARDQYTAAGLKDLCAWLTEAYKNAENQADLIF